MEVDVDYPKKLFSSHKDLQFLPKTKKLEKLEKLVCTIEQKYILHIRPLKQALNHVLILKDVQRVIKFHQEAWLKVCVNINAKLRKEATNNLEKDIFKLMNNSVFGKTMQIVRKHGDIKLVTTEGKIIKLVSEPNSHTTNHFSDNFLVIKIWKKQKWKWMLISDIRKNEC